MRASEVTLTRQPPSLYLFVQIRIESSTCRPFLHSHLILSSRPWRRFCPLSLLLAGVGRKKDGTSVREGEVAEEDWT